jgi:hypothetical protein
VSSPEKAALCHSSSLESIEKGASLQCTRLRKAASQVRSERFLARVMRFSKLTQANFFWFSNVRIEDRRVVGVRASQVSESHTSRSMQSCKQLGEQQRLRLLPREGFASQGPFWDSVSYHSSLLPSSADASRFNQNGGEIYLEIGTKTIHGWGETKGFLNGGKWAGRGRSLSACASSYDLIFINPHELLE